MNSIDKAVQVIYDEANQTWERGEILTAAGEAERLANALADAGLLAPDLPAPYTSLSTGEREWSAVDGYVNLHNGDLTVFYDERDEETYATEPAPEPGEIRITDTGQGRYLAYSILAACDLKDAHDE